MSKVAGFVREVVTELKKIVWPTRNELVGASIIVCILAVFFAIVLGAMDSGFGLIIRKIIG